MESFLEKLLGVIGLKYLVKFDDYLVNVVVSCLLFFVGVVGCLDSWNVGLGIFVGWVEYLYSYFLGVYCFVNISSGIEFICSGGYKW